MSEHHNHHHTSEPMSPEHIAYQLMKDVLAVEGVLSYATHGFDSKVKIDRQKLLDTYAECLLAVKQPNHRKEKQKGFAQPV